MSKLTRSMSWGDCFGLYFSIKSSIEKLIQIIDFYPKIMYNIINF